MSNKSISEKLIESFGYPVTEAEKAALVDPAVAARRVAARAAQSVGARTTGILSKGLTGVGSAMSAYDAYNRASKGDWVGAGLQGLAGAAYLVPGYGWAVGLGLDAITAARDYYLSSQDDEPSAEPSQQSTPVSQGSKPAQPAGVQKGQLVQIQKAIGATPDGVLGPDTKSKLQAWQKAHGLPADGIPSMSVLKAMKQDHTNFVQLQKVLGVNPDGFMGPSTKSKLVAWQKAKGLTPDGIPGPATYKAAGIIKESDAQKIADLSSKLKTIEEEGTAPTAKPIIINKDGKNYAFLPSGELIDQSGNLIDGSTPELPIIGKPSSPVDLSVIFSQAQSPSSVEQV